MRLNSMTDLDELLVAVISCLLDSACGNMAVSEAASWLFPLLLLLYVLPSGSHAMRGCDGRPQARLDRVHTQRDNDTRREAMDVCSYQTTLNQQTFAAYVRLHHSLCPPSRPLLSMFGGGGDVSQEPLKRRIRWLRHQEDTSEESGRD